MRIRLRWPLIQAIAYGLLGAIAATLIVGIPTDVVPNDFFTRMTPVRAQDYVFLVLTALLGGMLAASYAVPTARACPAEQGKATAAGFLSVLAVGCPVCNKIVVLLLGTSGAFTWFKPIQPVLGIASLALLGLAVWLRWRPALRTLRFTSA